MLGKRFMYLLDICSLDISKGVEQNTAIHLRYALLCIDRVRSVELVLCSWQHLAKACHSNANGLCITCRVDLWPGIKTSSAQIVGA